MPTIIVTDDTYDRLARRAETLGTTVDALAAYALDPLTNGRPPAPSADVSYDEWKRVFDGIVAGARGRAHFYPSGFEADVSREAMYEGCGE